MDAWFPIKSLKSIQKTCQCKHEIADLSDIDFDTMRTSNIASDKPARSWDDIPEKIKSTFKKIRFQEAERAYLAGASAQFESEVVYRNMKERVR